MYDYSPHQIQANSILGNPVTFNVYVWHLHWFIRSCPAWFLVRVVFSQGGFWSEWFLVRVVFVQSGFWSGWFLVRVVFGTGGFWSGCHACLHLRHCMQEFRFNIYARSIVPPVTVPKRCNSIFLLLTRTIEANRAFRNLQRDSRFSTFQFLSWPSAKTILQ